MKRLHIAGDGTIASVPRYSRHYITKRKLTHFLQGGICLPANVEQSVGNDPLISFLFFVTKKDN